MNKIAEDRLGVDGVSRSLESILDYLVGKVEDEIKEALKDKIPTLDVADQLVATKIKEHLHTLLTANVYRLNIIAKYFDSKYKDRFYHKPGGQWKSTDLGAAILDAFNYSHFRETVLVEVARLLNVKTCPYCNMHYTLYANEHIQMKRKNKVVGITRFQFDHFFDKLHYPMLSMSFYNLIPSCAVCNQGKSAKALSLTYHPYYSDIHKQFHFVLTDPLGPYTAARVNDEVEIQLVPETGVNKAEFEEYRDTFHLKSLYGRHGDLVQEVYDKAYEEPYYVDPTNFKFLGDRGSDYLKRLWLGNYTEPDEIEKRPMAKFMQDIWEQASGEKKSGKKHKVLP